MFWFSFLFYMTFLYLFPLPNDVKTTTTNVCVCVLVGQRGEKLTMLKKLPPIQKVENRNLKRDLYH